MDAMLSQFFCESSRVLFIGNNFIYFVRNGEKLDYTTKPPFKSKRIDNDKLSFHIGLNR